MTQIICIIIIPYDSYLIISDSYKYYHYTSIKKNKSDTVDSDQ